MKLFTKKNKILCIILSLTSSMVFFQNCSKNSFTQAPSQAPSQADDINVNANSCSSDQILIAGACEPVVCDALSSKDTNQKCNVKNGLVGNLFYMNLTYDQNGNVINPPSTLLEVDYYLKNGFKHPNVLFLSSLNVPTVNFTNGFGIDGKYLTNTQNVKITEYFGLEMYSSLKVSHPSEEGDYQLVIASDDGSVLEIAKNQIFEPKKHPTTYAFEKLIDNDGVHSVKVSCASQSIRISSKEALPIKVKYFQGPRTQISLSMYWKKIVPGQGLKSGDYCGQHKEAASDLAKDGFKIIPQVNLIAPLVF